ncbi:MAG: reverse transcriptase domain-containing protein [Candidatus Pseudobacter hemicellulosilyticus]|uniref:RNA-directed DNA polymerase n=1 Tax=Candidatus Pseudobacter hemicellulosilyticus TaxID=3121375 RepID=A0AAJ5WY24_9BACT|nr:MAG: reverse transcriptase domain-containing protein [Pseudobacter sp.]
MADSKLIRQQLYDRIRESSKDAVILEEMKRLGFWSRPDQQPSVPELLIRKEAELNKEFQQLMAQKRKFQDKEAILKEMRQKRMAEAKAKRIANKEKRELQRLEKAEAWQKRKETEILYLGEGVSAGLNDTGSDISKLQQFRLPVFPSENELAQAMGITLKELRFLAFSRRVSTVSHYRKFYLPKKSGGKRLISAPMPRLKKVQYWILENLLYKVPVHPAVHGFMPKRSIISNALQHVGKQVVLNIDVKDFFPSIHFKRVKGLLQELGYGEKIATILALLCTEATTEAVAVDGKDYFVQKGDRVLPQGAPTSPAITNILCYQLDKRLQGLAGKHDCAYTRYADDVSFSWNNPAVNAQQMTWRIKKILADEGFTVHPEKIRIMHKGAHQEVTGIVVNEKPGIDRKKLRRFRALLHQLQSKDVTELLPGASNPAAVVIGYANFVKQVKPALGALFARQIDQLLQSGRLPYIAAGKPPGNAHEPPPAKSGGQSPADDDKPWWNVV